MSATIKGLIYACRCLAIALTLALSPPLATAAARELPTPSEHDYFLYVFSNAVQGKDEAYNKWYQDIHIPDVLAVAGLISAQRFVRSDIAIPKGSAGLLASKTKYLAVYKIRTSSLAGVLNEINRRALSGQTRRSDTVDPVGVDLYVARVDEAWQPALHVKDAVGSARSPRKIYLQLEFAAPEPRSRERFNDWNRQFHVSEVLSLPGYVGAQPMVHAEVAPSLPAGSPLPGPEYVTSYSIATADIAKVLEAIASRKPIAREPSGKAFHTRSYLYEAAAPAVYAEELASNAGTAPVKAAGE